QRLSVQPVSGAPDLARADEELGRDVRVPGERLLAIGGPIVDRDDEASARQGPLAVVEREELPRVERTEAEDPKEAKLRAEAPRAQVDPLLSGLALAGQPVVDERAVGGRQAPPFGR